MGCYFETYSIDQSSIIFLGIENPSQCELSEITETDRTLTNLPDPTQDGHKNAHQNRYDRNHDQQFNERKSWPKANS